MYRTTDILFSENEGAASSPLLNGDVVQLGNSFMQSEEHRILMHPWFLQIVSFRRLLDICCVCMVRNRGDSLIT